MINGALLERSLMPVHLSLTPVKSEEEEVEEGIIMSGNTGEVSPDAAAGGKGGWWWVVVVFVYVVVPLVVLVVKMVAVTVDADKV